MNAEEFWNEIKRHDMPLWTGVPCSWLKGIIGYAIADKDITYIPVPREDIALGLASSCYFSGKLGGVLMQNSGLGNILGPLTSFNLIYRIPVLIIMSLRNDAPEHYVMGLKTTSILDTLSIPHLNFGPDSLNYTIGMLYHKAIRHKTPVIGLVTKNE